MFKYLHLKSIVFIFILFILIGCGYKPSATYAKNIVGQKISTDIIISAKNPENTVIIKDALDSAIVEVFHASLTNKKDASTYLTLNILEPSYIPIEYNSDGFVISYRATVLLKITRKTKNIQQTYLTKGTYNFSIVPNAVLTDQERFNAIKYGSIKAISAFISKISAQGSQIKR